MRDSFNNQESARLLATLNDDILLGRAGHRLMALAVGLVAVVEGREMKPEEAHSVVDGSVVAANVTPE